MTCTQQRAGPFLSYPTARVAGARPGWSRDLTHSVSITVTTSTVDHEDPR